LCIHASAWFPFWVECLGFEFKFWFEFKLVWFKIGKEKRKKNLKPNLASSPPRPDLFSFPAARFPFLACGPTRTPRPRSPGPAHSPLDPSARACAVRMTGRAHPSAPFTHRSVALPLSDLPAPRVRPSFKLGQRPRPSRRDPRRAFPPGHARLGLSRPINGIPGLSCIPSPPRSRRLKP
jgi:hypothetical protein